jgi:hypothetical protein
MSWIVKQISGFKSRTADIRLTGMRQVVLAIGLALRDISCKGKNSVERYIHVSRFPDVAMSQLRAFCKECIKCIQTQMERTSVGFGSSMATRYCCACCMQVNFIT